LCSYLVVSPRIEGEAGLGSKTCEANAMVVAGAKLVGRERERGLSSPKFLDFRIHPKFYYAKRRFPVTSKYRHIYGVLNIDEIKN
jgi:hypothetical protein